MRVTRHYCYVRDGTVTGLLWMARRCQSTSIALKAGRCELCILREFLDLSLKMHRLLNCLLSLSEERLMAAFCFLLVMGEAVR